MSQATPPSPKRGEVWRVDFDPTEGSEMQKARPAVVISSDAIGTLPVKLVAPITQWKAIFEKNIWHVRLSPTERSGLTKESAVDALQVRSADTSVASAPARKLPLPPRRPPRHVRMASLGPLLGARHGRSR
ncbi:MAG: PemK family transcriptional regulator [Bacteroidetes bacterium QH_9_67_14]|nr:MAG: PemK family transcriptional regulator [Bacteroidetes bacterium QH_9_67_14]